MNFKSTTSTSNEYVSGLYRGNIVFNGKYLFMDGYNQHCVDDRSRSCDLCCPLLTYEKDTDGNITSIHLGCRDVQIDCMPDAEKAKEEGSEDKEV
jgi:hypothetical protein